MKKLAILLFVLALCVPAAEAASVVVDLESASSFGILAGSGVTNSGNTDVNGDVGSSPTPTITGFPPGEANGIIYRAAGPVVVQAKLDLTAAYNAAAAAPDGNNLSGIDLSGKTLDPNIYDFNTSASFSSGNLTLDGGGDSNAQWIFKIGTTLTTASDFNVVLIDGAEANNVFWQVGSSATIGIRNNFVGTILANTNITLNGTGTLNGRALAMNGSVTISSAEDINIPNFVPSEANVPNVVGLTEADANTAIVDAGLVVGTITDALSNTVAAGRVISQNPTGGTAAAGGSDVNLVISLGRPVVPNVVGLTELDASEAITAADLTVGTITQAHSDTVAAGLVISQSPVSGTTVNIGTAVNLVVSIGQAVMVYKVNISEKNVLIDANLASQVTNLQSAALVKTSARFKGFLVFAVNISTLQTVFDANGSFEANSVEANFMPKLILNGTNPETGVKNSQWILDGTDVAIQRLITRETKPKTFGSLAWNVEGVSDANLTSTGIGWGKLVGTALVKGSKVKVSVPRSLKGNAVFEDFVTETNVPFSPVTEGTVSLSLDVSTTQKANLAGKDVNEVATELAEK